MKLHERLISHKEKLSVIGLGYVGLPLAYAFSKKLEVVAFDINEEKVLGYKRGKDVTQEVGDEEIKKCTAYFTSQSEKLRECKFHVVAVPTPINKDKSPDLTFIIGANNILGPNLIKGSVVVYESTVYPGVTEEICIPQLEKLSGLKCGIDFKVGYSPERINPGDKFHKLENIVKIVSAIDSESLEDIYEIYSLVVTAGVNKVSSIKVAEAAKVIENSQRDINIAFINELSIIFNKMGIDTLEVLKAASTKWNFLSFYPGLVGGHCIGVDPYYLTYKAENLGYHSQVILSGRRINDYMGKYIAENAVKCLIKANSFINKSKVCILGITFKENCGDIRNSKVIDIAEELNEYGIEVVITDPLADCKQVEEEYKLRLTPMEDIKDVHMIIVAVAHDEYKEMDISILENMFKKPMENSKEIDKAKEKRVIIDVKGILDKEKIISKGYLYWRL